MALHRAPTVWVTLGVLALVFLYQALQPERELSEASSEGVVEQLFETGRSGVVVEGRGVVDQVLRDDLDGSKHQRFVLRLDSGHTLLISHNIDLAPRVAEIARGDEVAFRGQYEWNERGGVVHWTHHDPRGERPGGWLRHQGRTYR